MTPTQLIAAAFMAALHERRKLHETWISASFRVGAYLPESMLSVAVQRAAELDLLIRSMEAAFRLDAPLDEAMLPFHYQMLLSEAWIGRVSAVFETVNRTKRRPAFVEWDAVARSVNLVRVSIEKHQIAHDQNQSMELVRYPSIEGDEPDTYDGNDPLRSFIPITGLSLRGSIMWGIIDSRKKEHQWVERQELSDRVLALCSQLAAPDLLK